MFTVISSTADVTRYTNCHEFHYCCQWMSSVPLLLSVDTLSLSSVLLLLSLDSVTVISSTTAAVRYSYSHQFHLLLALDTLSLLSDPLLPLHTLSLTWVPLLLSLDMLLLSL